MPGLQGLLQDAHDYVVLPHLLLSLHQEGIVQRRQMPVV